MASVAGRKRRPRRVLLLRAIERRRERPVLFPPLRSFEVALLESRPEGAATCQPRRGEPRLGFSVSASSGRQKSATSKLARGEKRRNEIGMNAQLVQDRLFIAPGWDRACSRIGLNAEALRHIMSLRRGERTIARLFSRLRVRAACRFPPNPGARIHEHSRAAG